MMLSRVAESVYWAGRYLERAEDTARLTQAYTHLIMDIPQGSELGWDILVRILDAEPRFEEHFRAYNEQNVLRFLLAFGLAFLYPVFLFAAAAAGLISSKQMASGRRWAILLVVVGAAVITPTGDILNLMILAVPLYLMYEITYWLVRLILKK